MTAGAAPARPRRHGKPRAVVRAETRRPSDRRQCLLNATRRRAVAGERPGARAVTVRRSVSRPRRASARRAAALSGTRRRSVPARARRRSTRPARRLPWRSRASTRAGPRVTRSRRRTARPRWRFATRSERNAARRPPRRRRAQHRRARTRARHVRGAPVGIAARRQPSLANHRAVGHGGAQVGHRAGHVHAVGRLPREHRAVGRPRRIGERAARHDAAQRRQGGRRLADAEQVDLVAARDRREPVAGVAELAVGELGAVVVGEPALVVGLAAPDAVDRDRLAGPGAVAEDERAAGAEPRRLPALAHRPSSSGSVTRAAYA